MSAVNTIETLIHLGITVKDAYNNARKNGGIPWQTFLQSNEFKQIEAHVTALLGRLGKSEVRAALETVEQKKKALVGGGSIANLPADKLLQYFDLLSVEGVLVRKELEQAAKSEAFFAWLVDEALPKLVSVAKVVVPLLV